ncbi:cytochrome P450 [Mycena sp. CBHHK59/15]|nr:cytochrome P450 [Mycena sp. CBHHK59/15]
MPPGPIGLSFIGNRHQMPILKPWLKFAQWSHHYGPVVSIYMGSTPNIILNSPEAAWDLLEKRSDIYSSCPRFIVASEILSDNKRGAMLPYGSVWCKWRKVMYLGFNSRGAETYKEIQSIESNVMILQILQQPELYEKHIERFSASVASSVVYGRRVESGDNWIVQEMAASRSWKYIVESLPFLLKLPRKLQWFRAEPEARRQEDRKFLIQLLKEVKERMKNSSSPECLAAQTLSEMDINGMTELEVAYAVASPFQNGLDTARDLSGEHIHHSLVSMMNFPHVMRKAQAELDLIVGPNRLPSFQDIKQLPYVRAVVNEALRWRPNPVLGGTPHSVTMDNVYNGMFIPKGSSLFMNFFVMMRDPTMFPLPDEFRPERFIETTNPWLLNFDLCFGFGRRKFPGMHLALNSISIKVACILWAFNITTLVDKHGMPILPGWDTYQNDTIVASFDCMFSARTEVAAKRIELECSLSKERLENWK